MGREWSDKIFSVTAAGFEALALEIFQFQYKHNSLYRLYTDTLGIIPQSVRSIRHIPFLPIRFFKTHEVMTGSFTPALVFESSGTTRTGNSRHLVKDAVFYEKSFTDCFRNFYDDPAGWCILALLPSYFERQNSSLVYMAEKLIKMTGHPSSGFYLDEFEKLRAVLTDLEKQKQKTLLLGVTFALLDFAEKNPMPLNHTIIMETGGMKGRKKELTRGEVHEQLKKAFEVTEVHSEYGMTELLSQAYAKEAGKFTTPPWMKIMIRDEEDPLFIQSGVDSLTHHSRLTPLSGAINIIDLANIYSCSFIGTDDVGRLYADGSFEVLGRMDGSDLRGCSLMVV